MTTNNDNWNEKQRQLSIFSYFNSRKKAKMDGKLYGAPIS